VLFGTGDQLPVIPLIDVVGKVKLAPEQMVPIGVKIGAVFGFTTIVKLAVVLQEPEDGVNV
jgi:hypothetical protein